MGPLGPVEEQGYTPTRQPTTAAPGPDALRAKVPDEATPTSCLLVQPTHHSAHPRLSFNADRFSRSYGMYGTSPTTQSSLGPTRFIILCTTPGASFLAARLPTGGILANFLDYLLSKKAELPLCCRLFCLRVTLAWFATSRVTDGHVESRHLRT